MQQFLIPLQKADVDTSVIIEEWENMVDYARRYLNIAEEDHQKLFGTSYLTAQTAQSRKIF